MLVPDKEALRVSELIANSANEVSQVGELAAQIEEALFDWIGQTEGTADAPSDLHKLDMLVQTCQELSQVLLRMASALANEESLSVGQILEDVRLGDLKERLGTNGKLVGNAMDRQSNDSVEFF